MSAAFLLCLLLLRADGSLASLIEERANELLADGRCRVRVVKVQGAAGLPGAAGMGGLEVEFAPGEDFLGKSSVRLRVADSERWLSVYFERLVPAWVAARRLERGQILKAGDLVEKPVALSRPADLETPRLEELMGGRLLTTLDAGQEIRREWVARPVVVRRGERLLVQVRSGDLLVQAAGQALADGRAGDVIPLANLASGKRISGRVLEAGLVEAESFPGRTP
jgi:flagella basal body P-ring formation protein FlgA